MRWYNGSTTSATSPHHTDCVAREIVDTRLSQRPSTRGSVHVGSRMLSEISRAGSNGHPHPMAIENHARQQNEQR